MRFVQFCRNNDGNTRLGALSDDGASVADLGSQLNLPNDLIQFIKSNPSIADLGTKAKTLRWESVSNGVSLLAPVAAPEKIVCVGLNYLDHCKETKKEVPKEPIFFNKFGNTLVGPNGNIILPRITNQMDWEVELAVIIGKEARHVSKENALDYVFGYSVAQDISARDWFGNRNGGQWLIGKSMDTFCPLGPAVVHKSLVKDPHNLRISCSVNGVQKQNSNTRELIFRIDDIIHLLSQSITLKPGDVILTGTPSGVGGQRTPPQFLAVGDVIESQIESLGKIRNQVIADTP